MKIGLFTETFWPQVNGVVVSACNINRELKKKGHNISVFTVGEGPSKHDGYNVYRFKGWTFKPYPEYKFLLPNRSICFSRGPTLFRVPAAQLLFPWAVTPLLAK